MALRNGATSNEIKHKLKQKQGAESAAALLSWESHAFQTMPNQTLYVSYTYLPSERGKQSFHKKDLWEKAYKFQNM